MRRTHRESKREGVKDPANGYVTGQNSCVAARPTASETFGLEATVGMANDTVWDVRYRVGRGAFLVRVAPSAQAPSDSNGGIP